MDLPLPHLDRPFDYLVPADADATVTVGSRVRIRFAGQLVDGYVLDRVAASDHPGRLSYLERAVSAEQVLDPDVLRLARAVADRYAGTLADVLRLAVPPRHARVESAAPSATPQVPPSVPAGVDDEGWREYRAGPAYLRALADGRAPRAVWTALPGEDWAGRIAAAAAAVLAGGRSALVIVPDVRDLERVTVATTAATGADWCVALSAGLGPQERYRRFLTAARAARAGTPLVVVGTRAAMFTPTARLGVVVIWDDGDDLHAEPRAPYPHALQVLLTRAQQVGAGVLVGGYARTAEAQLLVETGWARELAADRDTLRIRAPRVQPVGDDTELARDPGGAGARLPTLAWHAARDALQAGAPVLVQVPRRGYLPAVACANCRMPGRCPECAGPLTLSGAGAVSVCRWCGRTAAGYRCPSCGGAALRGSVVGARRTAEELGRTFPGATVRTSGRDGVLDTVPAEPALVIATPGAEPVADGGYGAVLLLDTWALLTRADLRAAEEALRRWLGAAALARPARDGGRVVVVADGALPAVQALLRFDPAWHAARELGDRRELGFPPAVRMASLTGTPAAVADLLDLAELPDGTDRLGPVPVSGTDGATSATTERMLLRVPRGSGPALAAALQSAAGVRSARKSPDPVRVQIDPLELL